MEELNVDGFFWLATDPEDKVAGRLTYSAESGAELDLIGSFGEVAAFGSITEDPVRMHGIAGNKLFTLDGCLQSNQTISMPGFIRDRYDVQWAFEGAHFDAGKPVEYAGVHLQLDHLGDWVRKTGTHVDITYADNPGGIEEIHIVHKPLAKLVGSSHLGELEVSFPFRFHPDVFDKVWIKQDSEFAAQFTGYLSLEDTLRVCAAVQDLVTIGVDSPTSISKLSLDTADGERVELYARVRGNQVQAETKSIHPARMIFTFDHIGGLSGIAAWLEVSHCYEAVTSSLLSHWYLPSLYEENRFMNVVIAAEALERIRTQQQNVNFKKALESLAEDAGDAFEVLVDDVESWAKEVVQVRVNQVVHRGLGGDVDGQRLYDLTESVYYLVVLCLLRECGVPEGAFSSMKQHQRFRQLARRLRR